MKKGFDENPKRDDTSDKSDFSVTYQEIHFFIRGYSKKLKWLKIITLNILFYSLQPCRSH